MDRVLCDACYALHMLCVTARRWDKDGSFWRTREGKGMDWSAGRIVVADRLGPIRKRDPLHCDLFVADRD